MDMTNIMLIILPLFISILIICATRRNPKTPPPKRASRQKGNKAGQRSAKRSENERVGRRS